MGRMNSKSDNISKSEGQQVQAPFNGENIDKFHSEISGVVF